MESANGVERLRFHEELNKLHTAAGSPSTKDLERDCERMLAAQGRLPQQAKPGRTLNYTTIQGWLNGASLPRDEHSLRRLLSTYSWRAQRKLPGQEKLLDLWRAAKNSKSPSASPSSPPDGSDPWVRLVEKSLLWKHACGAADEVASMCADVAGLAGRLALLREEAEAELADDPWADPGLAERIAKQTSLLLQQPLPAGRPHSDGEPQARFAPTPVEAALLVLLPLLHHVRRVRLAAGLADVRPADLTLGEAASADRQRYETFLRGQDTLLRRASLSRLADSEHSDSTREIGWWLLHRWIDSGRAEKDCESVDDMLEAAGVQGGPLHRVLEPGMVRRLLSSARRPPHELCGTDRPSHLQENGSWVHFGTAPAQHVREHPIGCLFALAHTMALEITDLSDVVVKHTGVRDPVRTDDLEGTLDGAEWTLRGIIADGITLNAECHHPAVVVALTERTEAVDDLLRVLLLRGRVPGPLTSLADLPSYANAHGVREAEERGRRTAAASQARFRLDEDRVRDLLTGERLYGDRSLAVRELYQNAMDACRYLRARRQATAQQNDETSGYRGRIRLRQGKDEHGRPYLECDDNGIGMGEAELTGVFAQAGARFAGQAAFHEEEAVWRQLDPPVVLYPNSRFGIGVLSYFMLAEEVRVTTRRDGARESLTAFITGPGNFFRIHQATEHRQAPGTTVRLYLREGDDAVPSCVDVLGRLLGIAEFDTEASDGGRTPLWEPGRLREPEHFIRHATDDLGASKSFYRWVSGDDGRDGQVVACSDGGALLVDGLLVSHGTALKSLGLREDVNLEGLVVNLTGASSPEELSVDRRALQREKTGATVRDLVAGAAQAMAADGRAVSETWLRTLAESSTVLADLFTAEAIANDLPLSTRPDGQRGHAGRLGHFWREADGGDYLSSLREELQNKIPENRHTLPDRLLLWRLCALSTDSDFQELADLFPALRAPTDVLPALPSDIAFFAQVPDWDYDMSVQDAPWRDRSALTVAELVQTADDRNSGLLETRARAKALGFDVPLPEPPEIAPPDAALLRLAANVRRDDFDGQTLILNDLIGFHSECGVDARSAADRLARYGFRVPPVETLPERPEDLPLLPYDTDETVSTHYLLAVSESTERPVRDVINVLRTCGLRTELDVFFGHSDVPEGNAWSEETVPPGFAIAVAEVLGLPLEAVTARIAEVGHLPPHLPTTIQSQDREILSRDPLGESSWWRAGTRAPLGTVLLCADEAGLTPAAVRERASAYGLETATVPPGVGSAETVKDALKLISVNGDGSWPWIDERFPVRAAVTVSIADALDITTESARERMHAIGLTVQSTLKGTAGSREDIALMDLTVEDGLDEAISMRRLVHISRTLGESCTMVAARLANYGLETASQPPAPQPGDARLLRRFVHEDLHYEEEPVPSVNRLSVLKAAQELGMRPGHIVDRLHAHAIPVCEGPFPESLVDDDRVLLNLDDSELPEGWTVPLAHIFIAAKETNRSMRAVYERLVELGLPVPTDESVAEAWDRVPRTDR